MAEKTYQEKVWVQGESGELEYVGELTKTIDFAEPIGLSPTDPNPISSITLKEPTAKHLAVFAQAQRTNDDVTASIAFIAANCGKAPTYINKLTNREFTAAMEFLGGFTKPEPKAGD